MLQVSLINVANIAHWMRSFQYVTFELIRNKYCQVVNNRQRDHYWNNSIYCLLSTDMWKINKWYLRRYGYITIFNLNIAYSDLLPNTSLSKISHRVDISRARGSSDIFIEDWPTTIHMLGNKSNVSKYFFRFKHRKGRKSKYILQIFPLFGHNMKKSCQKL